MLIALLTSDFACGLFIEQKYLLWGPSYLLLLLVLVNGLPWINAYQPDIPGNKIRPSQLFTQAAAWAAA